MKGQYRLTAPLKKDVMDFSRKLEDWIYGDNTAHLLLLLLAVPVRPISKLRESRRDLNAAQIETVSTDSLQESQMSGLTKHESEGETVHEFQTHGGNDALTFCRLPAEIHRLIFDHLDNIEDVICAGLTRRGFWLIALEFVDSYYMSRLGRWAGANIVCVEEEVEANDYPPSLFSDDEVNSLSTQQHNNARRSPRSRMRWPDRLDNSRSPTTNFSYSIFTLRNFGDDDFLQRYGVANIEKESLRIYSSCKNRAKDEDPAFEAARSDIIVTESTYLPEDQSWILRNLTTKEFVRAEVIALKPEYVQGHDIYNWGFGELVMSRIFWSMPSSDIEPEKIARGPWAGHCFDVTTLARHEETTNSKDWSDVSLEVHRETWDLGDDNPPTES